MVSQIEELKRKIKLLEARTSGEESPYLKGLRAQLSDAEKRSERRQSGQLAPTDQPGNDPPKDRWSLHVFDKRNG